MFHQDKPQEELEKQKTSAGKSIGDSILELLPRPALDYKDWYEEVTSESLRRCPQCGVGSLHRIETLQPCRPAPLLVDTS